MDSVTTRCVSVTPPATLLGGWAPPTTRRVFVTQLGPGCRDYSAFLRDSGSDLARGPGTTYYPARLHDSARASGAGAGTTRKVSVTRTRASGSGNRVVFTCYGYLELAKDWYPQGIGVTKMLAECLGIRICKS